MRRLGMPVSDTTILRGLKEHARARSDHGVVRVAGIDDWAWRASEDMALIAQQKLRIAKLERQVYGQRSERSARLVEQLALAFEELEAGATEDELAAERAVAKTTTVAGFTRKRPEHNTFPDHLPSGQCWVSNRLKAPLQSYPASNWSR
jgi:transposase